MSRKRRGGMTRRQFARITGAGALAAGGPAPFPLSGSGRGAGKDAEDRPVEPLRPGLRQVVRRHLHQGVGRRRTTRTSSSTTSPSARSTPARRPKSPPGRATTSSCSWRRRPLTRSRRSTTREIYEAVEKKHGKKIALAEKSTFNPKTKRYFAFSDSYVPDPGNYRKDLWEKVGFPNGPDTWEDLRVGGKKIKDQFGNPVGIGLSQELDTNMAMRALLWSFGGAEQDADGNVDDLLEGDDRGDQVHAGALQGDRDARGLHLGPVLQQPRASSPASSPSSTTRSP